MAQVAETPHLGNSIFVVGIDIGSTYSGYAFASKEDFQCVPPKFQMNVFCGSRLFSLKAPTAVLFDSNKQLKAFGYDAENQFSEIFMEEEQDEYYYFYQFPSMLHNQTVTRATEINDATGKSMPAITVFSAVIEYLKTQAIKKICDILKDPQSLLDDDCFFVLTVPAIWDQCTKNFMGEAAALAGIKKKKLAIIPEQKAASIYCQRLEVHREEEVRHSVSKIVQEGVPYMVIDLGVTTKITVLQRQPDGGISTVGVPPCVIPIGGKSIDEPFVDLLSNICGPDAVRELKETELEDYIELLREFETKKRSIKTDHCNKIVIALPVSLLDLVKKKHTEFENAIENSRYKGYVTYVNKGKLKISPETFRGLFNSTIKDIIELIGNLFKDLKLSVANTILMVGGFAECQLIQDAVRQAICITRTLIIPEEAGLAVLKGAVLFGHQPKPKVVIQRIARYTYGIQSCWPNMEPERYTENENLERGNDVFYKFITKGEQRGLSYF